MRTGWVMFWVLYFASAGLAGVLLCTSGSVPADQLLSILWSHVAGLFVFAALVCVAGSVCMFHGALVGYHPSVNNFTALGVGVGLILSVLGWTGWVATVARVCLSTGPTL